MLSFTPSSACESVAEIATATGAVEPRRQPLIPIVSPLLGVSEIPETSCAPAQPDGFQMLGPPRHSDQRALWAPKRSSRLGGHCWFSKEIFDERYEGPFARGVRGDHSTGHACANAYALRNIIDLNPDRNALGEPNPLEGRIDVRQELWAIRIVSIGDAATNAVNMPPQFGSAAHQMYLDRIPWLDHAELGLFEIAFYAIGVAIDEGDHLGPNGCVLADHES